MHISEISNRFIKDPSEALRAGQIVKVKVLSCDLKSKRIALSIKALLLNLDPAPKSRERKQQAATQPPADFLSVLSTKWKVSSVRK